MIVCPNCGANLKYSPQNGKMHCDFCESDFDPKDYDEAGGAQEVNVSAQEAVYVSQNEAEEDSEEDSIEVTIYTCPQCGGELMSVDKNTAAAFCSFCGASTILNSRITSTKKPKYIIPFSITKEQCKEAYLNLVSKSIFSPDAIKSKDCIESFRGIYMPYWSYDIKHKGEISIDASKSKISGQYEITDHYKISGDIDAEYKGISYDAASNFYDNISESIGPFKVDEQKRFISSYLSGFYADIGDVSSEVYESDAKKVAAQMSFGELKAKYNDYKLNLFEKKIDPIKKQIMISGPDKIVNGEIDASDATMFPVWFMSYKNKDRVAYAVVNGQTGKAVADLPIDIKKYLKFSGILALVFFIILCTFLTLTPTMTVGIATVLMILVMMINSNQRRKIRERENNKGDKGVLFVTEVVDLTKKREPMTVLEVLLTIASVVMILITLVVVSLRIPTDIVYYTICLFDAAIFLLNFKHTLENHNVLTTRKLPQFDKKGGDDYA